jgi:DNA-binding transcriptional MerR regulator
MSNVRLPVGVVIKQIIDEKGLKPLEVAGKLKVSRQNVYLTYTRRDMSDGEIRRWAHALGVTWDEINKRRDVTMPSQSVQEPTIDNSNYLLEHLSGLEEQFKRLLTQLETKDRQIEKLMDLLGKLDLSENKPCLVKEMYEYKLIA